jgi:hypothetical protein
VSEKEGFEIEQAELDKYMDVECLLEDTYLQHLRIRYSEILREYESFLCVQREAIESKREDLQSRMVGLFRNNYKSRKYIVMELRKRGEKVEDKFVL